MSTLLPHRRVTTLLLCLAMAASTCLVGQAGENWTPAEKNLEASPLTQRADQGDQKLFSPLPGPDLGIEFQNQLNPENIKNYLLSGAGLAVGDVDSNGLPDLFLVSQDSPGKLFLQTKPWHFQDVTKAAGIRDDKGWGSGAAFADIDNDGDLDLYLCYKGGYDILYLNQGDGTFEHNPFSGGNPEFRAPSMVAFSDYDLDGDLDLYRTETRLLSIKEMFDYKINVIRDAEGNLIPAPEFQRDASFVGDGTLAELGTYDHLYINESTTDPIDLIFRDVTRAAGISIAREHGLAAVWWDYNNDNYPDLYVSNDFHTPDHLYRNNRNGTFSDAIYDALPYTSWNSMGSDFADINNDGWFDYLSTDMSATTHFKQKTMMGAMSSTAWFLDNLEPRQYMRNAMQVNTGTGRFLDTAFYSGIDSTDWTWAGIFGDLDNDGLEDAYFTNGIERNVQDSDLSIRMDDVKQRGGKWDEIQALFLASPRFKEKNLAFQNKGDLRFDDVSDKWGLGDLTVSHGAVLTDLDRDGDLDLVVNNMNDPVGIYRNNDSSNQSILVSLRGTKSNHFGLGARVEAHLADGSTLTRLMTSSRGYLSGVEPVLHFGLGKNTSITSLNVTWPSGIIQTFKEPKSNFHYRVTEADSGQTFAPKAPPVALFHEQSEQLGLNFTHRENNHDDFASQPLLPNRLSRFGPALSSADINGDQLVDLFIGGAAGQEPALFLQQKDGTLKQHPSPALSGDQSKEDIASTWFDADNDGDPDLYLVSGGASEPATSDHYHDRLYLNDGAGNLTPAPSGTLPAWSASGSCVAPCDFDADGDLDLFVGARFVPGKYPTPPESALLINNGGTFTKADSPVSNAGLVTGATWADLDQDSKPDLLIAVEWGPVRLFKNTGTGLVETTDEANLAHLTGWWTSVATIDVDHDGDLDFVAGNFGLNTKYHVDAEHPATLFASDFGNNGELQLVEAKLKDGKLLPVRGRSCSTSAMPHLKTKAPTYTAFASLTLPELYTPDALETAQRLEANTLATTLFTNDGTGKFTATPLPTLSQLAPAMSLTTGDFNADGITDLALGQNFNAAQRETGRMNAGLGVILTGSKDGTLTELWPAQSGLTRRTDTRQIIATDLNNDQRPDLLIGANNEPLRAFLAK
ncbi:MAG: VCBS repeat-containing protein [Verrucomicrobiaceae bacterium]